MKPLHLILLSIFFGFCDKASERSCPDTCSLTIKNESAHIGLIKVDNVAVDSILHGGTIETTITDGLHTVTLESAFAHYDLPAACDCGKKVSVIIP
jgi:hypothetical protein